MGLTELSIKKPIAVTMGVVLCLLLGFMGYINIGADLFPAVNIPVMFINTTYPGASADEVEKDIIKPIEDAVAGISGLDKIHSTAQEGYARVILEFKLSADPTAAFLDTQKALEGVLGKLPKEAARPSLFKYDDGAAPILVLNLSGDKSPEELYNKAELLKERIERIEGVGNVSITGSSKKELVIKADKTRLEYYGISIAQIVNRLQTDNVTFPGGVIDQPNQEKVVRIEGEYVDINQVKDFRLPLKEGFVRLGDIAEVSLEYPKAENMARTNGKPAIGLTVQKQSDANIVETGKKVKSEVEKLKSSLNDVELKLVDDATVFITSSLGETQRNLIEGIITTGIVLFIFLRQWNSVFIVMIAIPTSLVSTFFMMYFSKFTFNILSLMGLALCVGILVDDSVVVLENIHRHLKMGKDPKTAAIEGRSEIGMAAIAITLSDVVVFAPIAFMSGITGQYFRQFGLVVVFATLISLLVSFTVTPMMASRMFKKGHGASDSPVKKKRFAGLVEGIEMKLQGAYEKLLIKSLKHRFLVVLIVVGLLALSVSFVVTGKIGAEFMPVTDSGEFSVRLTLNPGSTLENTDEKVRMVENYIQTIPELNYSYTTVGDTSSKQPNKGTVTAKLVDKRERKRSQKEIAEEARQWAREHMWGADVVVTEPSMTGGGEGGKPININISGSKLEVIGEITKRVEEVVKNTEGVIEVSNSAEDGKPSYKVKVDKVAASKYGLTTMDISNTIRSGLEGTEAGVYRKDGEDYDIKVKLKESSIKDINDLGSLSIMSNTGKLIPVNQVASISLSDSPAFVKRLNKQRVYSITANTAPGYTLGALNTEISNKLKELSIPDGYSISFAGEQEQMEDSFSALIQALILSIALVYMILVVLYESYLTPFVRILALPVGFIGALFILVLTGNTLNMMTMIGLIMLDGLAAKNGTILIDYTNTLMSRGYSLREALLEAGRTRLKPIMMTSFTMIVGMTPTALALGDGAEYKSGMALVIIGGMISSTILSPILLPVAYTIIDDIQTFIKRLFSKKEKSSIIQEPNMI